MIILPISLYTGRTFDNGGKMRIEIFYPNMSNPVIGDGADALSVFKRFCLLKLDGAKATFFEGRQVKNFMIKDQTVWEEHHEGGHHRLKPYLEAH